MLRNKNTRVHTSILTPQGEGLPLFLPLGVYQRPLCEPLYYFQIAGNIERFRASELGGFTFLLRLNPDPDTWRLMFPRNGGRRLDAPRAMAWLIGLCQQAGPYTPPAHLRPRGRGRPKKPPPSSP